MSSNHDPSPNFRTSYNQLPEYTPSQDPNMRTVIVAEGRHDQGQFVHWEARGYKTDTPGTRVDLSALHNFNQFTGNDDAGTWSGGEPTYRTGYVKTIDTRGSDGTYHPGSIYHIYDAEQGFVLEGVTSSGKPISVPLPEGATLEVGQPYQQEGQHRLRTRPVEAIVLEDTSITSGITRQYGIDFSNETTDIGVQYGQRIEGTPLNQPK